MEDLIKRLKNKIDSLDTSTKLERHIKGAYVDALIMIRETKEKNSPKQSILTTLNDYRKGNIGINKAFRLITGSNE